MNTKMADGAAQRCVAQIGEALFGQPGLTLMELAEKVKATQPSPDGQGGAWSVAESVGGRVVPAHGERGDPILLYPDQVEAFASALAARQPVGEPVAWKYQDKAADGVWEDRISERLPCWEHRNPTPLYAVPPAQTLGLGMFRKAVEAWKRDAENKRRAGEIFLEQKDAICKEADRLLALIDGKVQS